MKELKNPKNIILHPCPICKTQMEVEVVEIRKSLVEGEIDLEAVKKEWRHICTKCHHETTKFIKTCHYCDTPDDISKLVRNLTEKNPDKTYHHESCHSKAQVPYYIIGFVIVLILAGVLLAVRTAMKHSGEEGRAITLIKKAEGTLVMPYAPDPSEAELYQQKRNDSKALCLEAISLDSNYTLSYRVLGELYAIDDQWEDAAYAFRIGEKTAIFNHEKELEKYFNDQLKDIEKKHGVKIAW